ncbi:response regulator [Roseospira goensis]|uniref:DNA-binding response OmpR family regulator n=1 Tax=Roseospira goensis TaxID=391922 RepID=A0A7W6S258_9PROT|nr:response regulator [Roseospira goensis]MBB4286797.1 DNA-binding response OmpR family regulator [Roseospira goensis]
MGGYTLERLNFLIVDDSGHMRTLVKTILGALGATQVQEARDGATALTEMRHFPADIVVCDRHMAPMDGLAFVRRVRTGSDSPNPFVPIIMLTGETAMTSVVEARDAGVHEFLAKPISARSLYARIQAIIERPRPFVRTPTYFGPNRRRRQVPWAGPERRRTGRVTGGRTPP